MKGKSHYKKVKSKSRNHAIKSFMWKHFLIKSKSLLPWNNKQMNLRCRRKKKGNSGFLPSTHLHSQSFLCFFLMKMSGPKAPQKINDLWIPNGGCGEVRLNAKTVTPTMPRYLLGNLYRDYISHGESISGKSEI